MSAAAPLVGGGAAEPEMLGEHNLQRRAALVRGGPAEHTGSIITLADPSFELQRTIFHSLTGVPAWYQRTKLGVRLYWESETARAIMAAYASWRALAPSPTINSALLAFMDDECDFKSEHADGSFMDHLRFVHEYAAAHFKQHSPRVLLLHSICGVATNIFPMDASKLPQLRGLLTATEATHVLAFPSVLRLLIVGKLLDELTAKANQPRLHRLVELRCCRVFDNEPLTLSAAELWDHLNYHLIHLIDFLPAESWEAHLGDFLFSIFARLHAFLGAAGKLEAEIRYDATPASSRHALDGGKTFGQALQKALPDFVKLGLARKQVRKFSAAIGHSLEYELVWRGEAEAPAA